MEFVMSGYRFCSFSSDSDQDSELDCDNSVAPLDFEELTEEANATRVDFLVPEESHSYRFRQEAVPPLQTEGDALSTEGEPPSTEGETAQAEGKMILLSTLTAW